MKQRPRRNHLRINSHPKLNFLDKLNKLTGLFVAIAGISITILQFSIASNSAELNDMTMRIEISKSYPQFDITWWNENFEVIDLNSSESFYRNLRIKIYPVLIMEMTELLSDYTLDRRVANLIDIHAFNTYLSPSKSIKPSYYYRDKLDTLNEYFQTLFENESNGIAITFNIIEIIEIKYSDFLNDDKIELYYPEDDGVYRFLKPDIKMKYIEHLVTLEQVHLNTIDINSIDKIDKDVFEKNFNFVPIEQALIAVGVSPAQE